jgi:hypothetical protein
MEWIKILNKVIRIVAVSVIIVAIVSAVGVIMIYFKIKKDNKVIQQVHKQR